MGWGEGEVFGVVPVGNVSLISAFGGEGAFELEEEVSVPGEEQARPVDERSVHFVGYGEVVPVFGERRLAGWMR